MASSFLRKNAWFVLAVGELGVLLYGILILVNPDAMLELGYESFTGESWAAFQEDAPESGAYFALVVRMLGGYNMAFGIVSLWIVLRPFRAGEAWAWWSLLLGNLLAYGVPMSADIYAGSIGLIEVVELTLGPLMALALAVTASRSLGEKGEHTHG